jgi:hypothetical protein
MRPLIVNDFFSVRETNVDKNVEDNPHLNAERSLHNLSEAFYEDTKCYDLIKEKIVREKTQNTRRRRGKKRTRRRVRENSVTILHKMPIQQCYSPWMRKTIMDLISNSNTGSKKYPLFVRDESGIDLQVEDKSAVIINMSMFGIQKGNLNECNSDIIYRAREHRRSPYDSFLAAKVARSRCKELGLDFLNNKMDAFERSFQVKTHIKRGASRTCITMEYVCFGTRKDPNSNQVSEYAFNAKKCSKKEADSLNETVRSLVYELERRAATLLECMGDTKVYEFNNDCINVPTYTNQMYCTQFSIGKDYWSAMHVDDDYFYTTLSCFHPSIKKGDDTILYHFVFPEYGLAIPMRHGDILIFNPTIMHCCTNPRLEGSYITSAYVSKKTVMTYLSSKH